MDLSFACPISCKNYFMWGVVPTRRVPFVSAKGTKTIFACARSLRACSEAGSPGCLRLAQRIKRSKQLPSGLLYDVGSIGLGKS